MTPLFQKLDETSSYSLQIDNSSLELFTTCPTQALFAKIYRRVKSGDRLPLIYGAAIHAGLEAYYSHAHTFNEDIIHAIYAEFSGTTNEFSNWRTPELACEALESYISHYSSDTWHILRDQAQKPLVEIPFSVPLGVVEVDDEFIGPPDYLSQLFAYPDSTYVHNIHVYWTGKIDLIIKDESDIWIVDHKTTSILSKSFFDDFHLNQATIGYVWAARTLSYPAVGLILNIIAARAPSKTGTHLEFERRRFFYPSHRLDEFVPNTLSIVTNFIQQILHNDFPRHTKWCCGKYGTCQFHDVCLAPPSHRLQILNSPSFTTSTWSPLT